MKYIKEFEGIVKSFDDIFSYNYKDFRAIGKLRLSKTNSLNYEFYDYFCNYIGDTYEIKSKDVNFNTLSDGYIQIKRSNINKITKDATDEEKNKYMLSVCATKFNI